MAHIIAGCSVRDDDRVELFGGAIYLYNGTSIKVAVPTKANGRKVGHSVYTGTSVFIRYCPYIRTS